MGGNPKGTLVYLEAQCTDPHNEACSCFDGAGVGRGKVCGYALRSEAKCTSERAKLLACKECLERANPGKAVLLVDAESLKAKNAHEIAVEILGLLDGEIPF